MTNSFYHIIKVQALEWASYCCFLGKVSTFSAISWLRSWEQLTFDKMMMMVSDWYLINKLYWICIMLDHWNNTGWTYHSTQDTLSRFWANRQISISVFDLTRLGLEPMSYCIRGKQANTTKEVSFMRWVILYNYICLCL